MSAVQEASRPGLGTRFLAAARALPPLPALVRLGPAPDLRLAVVGAAAALVAVVLPWAHVGMGGSEALEGAELHSVRLGIPALAVAAVVACAWGRTQPIGRSITAVLGGAQIIVCGLAILALESVAAIVPRSLLPVTVRRLSVEVAAGAGAWLALGSGILVVVAAAGVTSHARLTDLRTRSALAWVGRRAPVLILAAAAGALAAARYQPWAEADVAGQTVAAEGFTLPWAGPATLVPVWVLVVCVGASLRRPGAPAALAAATAAWAASFLAALVLIATRTVSRTRLGDQLQRIDQLPDSVATADLEVRTGSGAVVSFVAALVAGAAAVALLAQWGREDRRDRGLTGGADRR